MVRRVTAPRATALVPQSHTATVERRTSGGFIDIGVGDLVAPGEPVRYSASGAGGFGPTVTFRVTDSTGNLVFVDTASVNFAGNAWVDAVAPSMEGVYSVEADLNIAFFPDHSDFTSFVVSVDAPPPPPPPPGGGGFFPGVNDLKTFGYIALAGGGLILALQLLGATRQITGAR